MAIIKCKMCGGDMELSPDKTFGTCEYCGSVMTLPKVDDDQRAAQFNRGNHFRRQGEFDKALAVYERIVAEDDTDAEAHWCCALCRFGIEYVEDPATYEYIPTCHRASFDSFLEDVDYLAAVEHSDGITRRQYQKDGAKIAEVQRAILATSQKEEPFDVFICYKETDDETKERTRDSLDAQEIYYNLTQEGYRVFFARITLEDKAGTEYEPYIFAALNSAKVMVVVGEKAEYFNAVWVKNEWSRFLSLMRKDRTKLLLPCYKNVDPYDLPEQLGVLQSYDMAKIGFMQDLIRGIKKLLGADEPKETVKETVVVQQSPGGANITAQIKRGMQALEDKDWAAADGFFDKALDMDAECAEAFFGKALAAEKCSSGEELAEKRISQAQPQVETLTACERDDARIEETVRKFTIPDFLSEKSIRDCFHYDDRSFVSCLNGWKNCITLEKAWWERTDRNLSRALRYAKSDTAREYAALKEKVMAALEENRAASEAEDAKTIAEITERYAKELEEAEQHASELYEAAVNKRKKAYDKYCKLQAEAKTVSELRTVCATFESAGFRGYEDCDERVKQCLAEIERLEKEKKAADRAKAEAEERQRIAEKKAAAAERKKKAIVGAISGAAVVAVIAAVFLVTKVIIPGSRYKAAEAMLAAGDYDGAAAGFAALGEYKDSADMISEAHYQKATAQLSAKDYDGAAAGFVRLGNYKDSAEMVSESYYQKAAAMFTAKDYDGAVAAFAVLGGYKDSADMISESYYQKGKAMFDAQDYDGAVAALVYLGDYKDSAEMLSESYYQKAVAMFDAQDYYGAVTGFDVLGDYKDSADRLEESKAALLLYAEVGSYVFFGEYEQDNDTSNSNEKIEWLVLDKNGDDLLVISRYALDCQQFNKNKTAVYWEKCSLRKWLNDTFLSKAFNVAEQAKILTTTVEAEWNLGFTTDPGNNTKDQVFLLSITEAQRYFSSDTARQCEPTAYAKAQGCTFSSDNGTCWWWLRTPGKKSTLTVYVNANGFIYADGNDANTQSYAVRPVMWISLES